MHVKLIVVEGQARQREIEVELPAWIGRSRAAAVTIGDPKVSRQHCELFEQDGVLLVRDNESMNGTWIDGVQIEHEAVVEPGAKITVGPLTLMALYEPAGALPAAQPAAVGEPDFAALIAGEEEDVAEDDVAEEDSADSAADETIGWLPPAADAPANVAAAASLLPPAADAEPAEAAESPPAALPVPRAIEPGENVPIAEPATDDPVEEPAVPVPEPAVPADPAPIASDEGDDATDDDQYEDDVDDEALGDFFKGLP